MYSIRTNDSPTKRIIKQRITSERITSVRCVIIRSKGESDKRTIVHSNIALFFIIHRKIL
jgi:hypothetical protein